MSLENLDIFIFRNPTQYITWFDANLESVNEDPTNHRSALLHQGDYKFFYEEIFPLACLLRNKQGEWKGARFRHIKGSQNFDVEIQDHPLRYLEIVTTDFDDAERYRMQSLLAEGHVDALNPIVRDERNRPDSIANQGEMRDDQEIIQEELEKIKKRILAKSDKSYPEATGLLVYYNDYKCYPSEFDRPTFDTLLDELTPIWSQTFDALFVVGSKGEHTFERTTQTLKTT